MPSQHGRLCAHAVYAYGVDIVKHIFSYTIFTLYFNIIIGIGEANSRYKIAHIIVQRDVQSQ